MIDLTIAAFGRTWRFTTDHPASSHGIPVVIGPNGTPYGPWDNVSRSPLAIRYAAEIAMFAAEDHPDDATIQAAVAAFRTPMPAHVLHGRAA